MAIGLLSVRGGGTMKNVRYLFIAVLFLLTISGGSYAQGGQNVLFQASMYSALDKGVYEGEITVKDLKQHGDFGLGTFNAVDGEMIGLDGEFYQVKVDGVAYRIDDSMQTPFALVTFFEPDKTASLNRASDFEQLRQHLDKFLPTKNIFYAIKIEGAFKYIKARSVPAQERPYPPLSQIFKNQSIFEFRDVRGTLVGFRCPSYVKGINVPGYHFHFITQDKKAGGHVLECNLQSALAEIDYIPAFYLALPESGDFFKVESFQ
jgi:acetolactate decarboxylase